MKLGRLSERRFRRAAEVVALAAAASRMLASFLFGGQGFDPLTYMVLTSVLILAAVGAAYVPARQTTKIDPMLALRCE